MNISDKIERAKELITQREAIDMELAALFAGGSVTKKTNKCSLCGETGHSVRTCPDKDKPKSQPTSAAQSPPPQATSFMSANMK